MKTGVFGILCVVAVLGLCPPAAAVIGTIDDVPAATLLLPYFEVDLGRSETANTVFTINNASATAILAHVVVWSDLSVPVLNFNVYLTGYDVQQIDMRQLLTGKIPVTATDGQDPTDTISNQGDFSQDINFASCNGQLPPARLSSAQTATLKAALTGRFSSALNGCAGLPSSLARGYVTVDTVNNCTTRVPGDAGYFGSGGSGDVTNQNVLWGDVVHIDRVKGTARGESLVHVEASASDPLTSTSGNYTFYGRYVSWDASDNREPLATTFAARFVGDSPFSQGTRVVVWRDSKAVQAPFVCGALPSWYPLTETQIVAFNEQEDPTTLDPTVHPFPAETQAVRVGNGEFPVPYTNGWLFLDLNFTAPGPTDPTRAQAWVSVWHLGNANRRAVSVGYRAIQLDNASQ